MVCPHKHRFTEETDMDCQATLSISVTQCDPTSATTPLHWPAPATVHVSCPAKQLSPQQRRDLAIQVLAGTETVSELAREHEVSRKFLYQQVHTAQQGSTVPSPLFCDPRRSSSTCRLPSLGCGNWSWPWCSSAIARPAAWSNCCARLRFSDLPGDRAQHRAQPRCSGPEDQPAVRPLHHRHRPPR